MQQKRSLPVPFVILILAGVVALGTLVAQWSSGTVMARDASPELQSVEQERIAMGYLRVLTWLSDLTQHTAEPTPITPQHMVAQPREKQSEQANRRIHVALCALRSARNLAAMGFHSHLWD